MFLHFFLIDRFIVILKKIIFDNIGMQTSKMTFYKKQYNTIQKNPNKHKNTKRQCKCLSEIVCSSMCKHVQPHKHTSAHVDVCIPAVGSFAPVHYIFMRHAV